MEARDENSTAHIDFAWITEILNEHPGTCKELFRLRRDCFVALCDKLKQEKLLRKTHHVRVEEAVTIFCMVVGHANRMRVVADRFQHSTETICRHVNHVANALCRLGQEVLVPIPSASVHPYVRDSSLYFS